jgi:osmotically-inducible protein OsmY
MQTMKPAPESTATIPSTSSTSTPSGAVGRRRALLAVAAVGVSGVTALAVPQVRNALEQDAAALGRLTQLTVTRQPRTLRHVVVTGRSGRKVLVPARLITGLTAQQLTLRLRDGSVKLKDRLVPYRSDERLRREVHDKLFDYEPMRLDLPAIEIVPIDGTVWLRGHISSDGMRRLAEEKVQGITGLVALHNELVADDALAAAVLMALARDRRTAGAGQHIGVYPRLGTIRLRGSVQTPAAREIASAIAAAVPMVGPVVDELHIAATAETLSSLAGVTNQYDLVPGGR